MTSNTKNLLMILILAAFLTFDVWFFLLREPQVEQKPTSQKQEVKTVIIKKPKNNQSKPAKKDKPKDKIFKCTSPSGQVFYQSSCPDGSESKEVEQFVTKGVLPRKSSTMTANELKTGGGSSIKRDRDNL